MTSLKILTVKIKNLTWYDIWKMVHSQSKGNLNASFCLLNADFNVIYT